MNKVILTGRLTKNPEMKGVVAIFTLAVERDFKQEGQPTADFINCVAFGKRAETICNYLTKGKLISVVGAIRINSYEASDGTKKSNTNVAVSEFYFLEKSGNSNGGQQQAQQTQQNNRPQVPQLQSQPQQNFTDDDMPF